MKDDSLSDTQQQHIKFGYCPKCDRNHDYKIDCSVGKCDCDIGMCTHRANCRLKPLKIAEAEMSKVAVEYPNNVYATRIWNEAIEAAARCIHNEADAKQVRKLKK